MSSTATRTALTVLLFSLGLECLAIAQLDCWRICRNKKVQDRIRCVIRCRVQDEGKSGRVGRSPNIDPTATPLPSTKLKIGDACSRDFRKFKDTRLGIKNSQADVREIVYSIHKNKTIARVIWDPPAECLEKQDLCQGYFIQLSFGRYGVPEIIRCFTIHNKKINYIILNESSGFDGRKSFAVNVRAIPHQGGATNFRYIDPPSQDELAKPLILTLPTTEKPKTTNSSPAIPITNSTKSEPSLTRLSKTGKDSLRSGKESPTTLIFSLSVFTVVIIASVGLVAKWIYNRKKKIQRLGITQKRYNQVIKGTIYISYLPEKTTRNQVGGIYSWLKSHDIDVVIDQMYNDHKLYNSLGPKKFGEKFLAQADKVIMIVTPGYLQLCWLDDTVDIESMPCFNSLDEERLYSEVTSIKNELSTTLKHGPIRFVPVLVNVSDDYLPKWLQKLTSVKWPDDSRNNTFLNLLKGDNMPAHTEHGKIIFV